MPPEVVNASPPSQPLFLLGFMWGRRGHMFPAVAHFLVVAFFANQSSFGGWGGRQGMPLGWLSRVMGLARQRGRGALSMRGGPCTIAIAEVYLWHGSLNMCARPACLLTAVQFMGSLAV